MNAKGVSEPFHGIALERRAFSALVASACAGAFSLPLGRILLAVSAALLVAAFLRARRWPRLPPVFWAVLAYVGITIVVTVVGPHPERGIPKLSKLIWFIGIPVGALLVHDGARLRRLAQAYVWGCVVLVFKLAYEHAAYAGMLMGKGRCDSFGSGLVYAGSMTDGQRLMVGLLLALGIWLTGSPTDRRAQLRQWICLALVGCGLVLNLKRGSWICTATMAGALLALRSGWRALLALALAAATALAIPTVRDRFAALEREFDMPGGRLTMWTKVAPAILREHPWGIGYRGLGQKTLRYYAPEIERGRNHLHSNPVQIVVESGWLGLGAFLAWMALGMRDAVRGYRTLRADARAGPVALGAVFALAALMANGLVEYNMGDGEIVLVYGLLMGAAAGLARGACGPADQARLR